MIRNSLAVALFVVLAGCGPIDPAEDDAGVPSSSDGGMDASACVEAMDQGCTSECTQLVGRIQCDGTCSVPPPPDTYGLACSNACHSGTFQCDGTCSALPPHEYHGQECVMRVNGRTVVGFYDCNGTCA